MNFEHVMQLIGRWGGTLKFFPSDSDARFGIAEEMTEMCGNSVETLEWLVKAAPKVFAEWPGTQEIRALLCSKFRPADGVEVYSTIHPHGIRVPDGKRKALQGDRALRGARDIADTEVKALIGAVAQRKGI